MQQESFYDMLLSQPLFQGLGRSDLTAIFTKTKLDFQNYEAGDYVRLENDPCRDLLFILKGDIEAIHASENRRVTFHETWRVPTVVGTETVFGLTQHYHRTYRAATDLQTLSISKEFVTRILLHYDVFRFNLLGMLSTQVWRTDRKLWELPAQTLLHRFLQICMHNFARPYGQKEIRGKMVDLALYVDATRLNLSHLLNWLEDAELLSLERKRIKIPAFERLVRYGQDNRK